MREQSRCRPEAEALCESTEYVGLLLGKGILMKIFHNQEIKTVLTLTVQSHSYGEYIRNKAAKTWQ